MGKQFRLMTALTPEECASRLAGAIDHRSYDLSRLSLGGGSKPVLGEVRAGTFVLNKRITGRNSFQTFATGNIQPSDGGTLIAGQFSAHPGFRLGYGAWGCCAVLIGVPIMINLAYELGSGATHFGDLWSPSYQTETMGLLLLTFVPLLFAAGRVMAAGENDFLRNFLKQVLEAHEV